MADTYPGPFCQQHQITISDVEKGSVNVTNPINPIPNGLVLEINSCLEKTGHNSNDLFNIVVQLNPEFKTTSAKYLKNKISRLCEQKKKIASKKKVPGIKNVKDLLNAPFPPPISQNHRSAEDSDLNEHASGKLAETISGIQNIHVSDNINIPQYISVSIQTDFDENESDCDLRDIHNSKYLNLIKYEKTRLEKHSKVIENKIQEQKSNLSDILNRIGHYSIRNVNKRDETAKKNLHLLRDSQRQALKHERLLLETSQKLQDAEKKICCLTSEAKVLTEENEVLKQNYENEKAKKVGIQKMNSYFKNEINTLRKKLKDCNEQLKSEQNVQCQQCLKTNAELQEKEEAITELEEKLKDQQSERVITKEADGSYSNEIRLCVIELSGLEVAVEKVPEVIRTVSKHLHKRNFEQNELPTSTTVQSIVDEGHFLAKTFISQKLIETDNWGLNRDGTTRRKQKILDTAITLDSGDVISLGFNRVAHETAVSINNVTKSHITELANLNCHLQGDTDNTESDTDLYIKTSLEKLAFTMNDRANNEKKASVLLNEWRDKVLKNNVADYSKVNSFHCMAHVLLGFHTYVCKDMKEHEKLLSAKHGPLGRDSLDCFKFWSKKKSVVERVSKTTSDVFGPSGDHHGVRDLWEAHCAANGIKSVIGNYKDNRFNGLFQTAAEICLHRDDFIHVLESVSSPNLLIKSVLTDLKSDTVMTLLQSLGLFYVSLTGPYWNLVVGNKVPYLELHKEINMITQYLKEIEENPASLLQMKHWSETDTYEISEVPYKKLLGKKLTTICGSDYQDMLYDTVRVVAKAVERTVQKQLVDFLGDGQYSKEATEKDIAKTGFAHLTNLGCEHHFGDLDSSQRRRPRASLHHHSSVQLIKRNRSQMMTWLTEMPNDNLSKLLKSARKGGKELCQKHQEQDKAVLNEIHSEMNDKRNKVKKKNQKRKAETNMPNREKRRPCDSDSESESYSDVDEEIMPSNREVCENDYVAVAYHDSWYPGVVKEKVNADKVVVRFLTPCIIPGHFKWPARDDIQVVETKFILVSGFLPDCVNSGRQWKIEQYISIEKMYQRYAKMYF